MSDILTPLQRERLAAMERERVAALRRALPPDRAATVSKWAGAVGCLVLIALGVAAAAGCVVWIWRAAFTVGS